MFNGKPTIIWDVDDVLNNLTCLWFENYWVKSHPECLLKYRDMTINPPYKLLGVEIGEYRASLDSFRLSGVYENMLPAEEVIGWFRLYGEEFRHVVLTAPPLRATSIAAEWVLRHFGGWVRSYNFVPSKRDGEKIPLYDQTKKEFLSWLGKGDVLVDDNVENIEAAKSLGMKTVLIPQPWNDSRQTLPESLESLLFLARGAARD
jgi:hypothetical protein